MTLEQKIDIIIRENGLKDQKELAKRLDLNYTVFNRNINEDNLTGDMIKAFSKNDSIKCNMRWLINVEETPMVEEPREEFGLSSSEKLDKAIDLIHQVKEEVSRK